MLTDIEFTILLTVLEKREARPIEIIDNLSCSEATLFEYLKKLHADKKYLGKKSRPNKKEKSTHNTYYFIIDKDADFFIKFAKEFVNTQHWNDFHSSAYCQEGINPGLLRKIEEIWDTEPFSNKINDNPFYFTENNVLEILRESPTSLKKSLDNPLDSDTSEGFTEMLLAAFLLDNHDFKVESEISVKFNRAGQEPFFKRCVSSLITFMPGEFKEIYRKKK